MTPIVLDALIQRYNGIDTAVQQHWMQHAMVAATHQQCSSSTIAILKNTIATLINKSGAPLGAELHVMGAGHHVADLENHTPQAVGNNV